MNFFTIEISFALLAWVEGWVFNESSLRGDVVDVLVAMGDVLEVKKAPGVAWNKGVAGFPKGVDSDFTGVVVEDEALDLTKAPGVAWNKGVMGFPNVEDWFNNGD